MPKPRAPKHDVPTVKKPISIDAESWATIERLADAGGIAPTRWCSICLERMAAQGVVWVLDYVQRSGDPIDTTPPRPGPRATPSPPRVRVRQPRSKKPGQSEQE